MSDFNINDSILIIIVIINDEVFIIIIMYLNKKFKINYDSTHQQL